MAAIDDQTPSPNGVRRRRAIMGAFEHWSLAPRFGVAILAVLAGLALRFAFLSSLGEQSAYLTLYPAVAIAAIIGGAPGGVLATLLSVLAVETWVNPVDQRLDLIKLGAFLAGSAIIVITLQLVRIIQKTHLNREIQRLQVEQLRAIVDTAMEGIVTIDKNGIIQSANPIAREMYGYRPSELIGSNINMLMAETDPARGVDIASDLSRREKTIPNRRRKVRGIRKNGEIFPQEMTLTEAPLDGDVFFVAQMRDLSAIEQEKRKTEAARAELMHVARLNDMSEVAAGLAHEVSQPLTAILGYASRCRRNLSPETEPKIVQAIEVIEDQAKNAANILNRLRGFIEKRRIQALPGKSGATDQRRGRLGEGARQRPENAYPVQIFAERDRRQRRPGPDPAGVCEFPAQRIGRHGRSGRPGNHHPNHGGKPWICASQRLRQRPRNRFKSCQSAVHAFCHHQDIWHECWPVALQDNRPEPRR